MRVLVTTDGSPRSLQALAHASHLATALGAEIVLLRVLEPRREFEDEWAAASREDVRALAAAWRHDLASRLDADSVPGRVRVVVADGEQPVADVILRTATASRVRLIAMATHGAGLARRVVLGSVASAVLARASVPVMLVGRRVGPASSQLPYRLTVTTDGSTAATAVSPATRALLRGAPAENVSLVLLRVYQSAYGAPPREDALAECRRELAAFRRGVPRRFPLETEVVEQRSLGGADRAILAAAARHGAHAIAMATHGRSFARQILAGSVALSTVRSAGVPVILSRSAQ